MDDHNNKRHSPISLEDVWRTAWWPNRCFAFLLSVTEVNIKLAYEYFFQSGPPAMIDFRKEMAAALIYNIHLDSRPVGRPVRVLRPLTSGHSFKKVEQYKLWKNGAFVTCQTKFAQRQCASCKRKVRTYCSCNPGQTLCIDCYTEHVSKVRDAENADD